MNSSTEMLKFSELMSTWLWTPSFQAILVIVLVLVIQALFRRQFTAQWRAALWWLVVVKLVVPWGPSSPWSLYNWVPGWEDAEKSDRRVEKKLSPSEFLQIEKVEFAGLSSGPGIPKGSEVAGRQIEPQSGNQNLKTKDRQPLADMKEEKGSLLESVAARHLPLHWVACLQIAWFLGVLCLLLVVLVRWARFARLLRRSAAVPEEGLRLCFDECRREFGWEPEVELIETELTSGPALFGLLKPKMLMPKGMWKQFSTEELRCIFFHEFAHLQRRDLLQNMLITVLQILHWFNPMVWFAFHRLRIDRECACDELALRKAGAVSGREYGQTVVKLLERLHGEAAVPGGIGIMERKSQMHRRVSMIVRYTPTRTWSLFAILLFMLVAWVSLTGAQSDEPKLSITNSTSTNVAATLDSALPLTTPERRPSAFYAEEINKPLNDSHSEPQDADAWKWRGRVVDADTLEPLKTFQIVIGEVALNRFGHFLWERKMNVTNAMGTFLIHVRSDMICPALEIRAEGYRPIRETILPKDNDALEFKLRRDSGLKGTLLNPDGTPAAFVRVAQIESGYSPLDLSEGRMATYSSDLMLEKTDKDGRFEFEPEFGHMRVLAATANGFALVNEEVLRKEPIVRLKPYGRIQGNLRKDGIAVSKAPIDIAFASSLSIRIARMGHAVTDEDGGFELKNVPPGRIQLRTRSHTTRDGSGWIPLELKEVEVKPGETLVAQFEAPPSVGLDSMVRGLPGLPQRIQGVELEGTVLSPDGKPAAGAEVVLQIPGENLVLGRGTLLRSSRLNAISVTTEASGRFKLPLYEDVHSLVAVSKAGIAHVGVSEKKPKVTVQLEPWCEIRGTFMIGKTAGANRRLRLQMKASLWPPAKIVATSDKLALGEPGQLDPYDLSYPFFRATTDKDGQFIFSFVPPGDVVIQEDVRPPSGNGHFRWVSEIVTKSAKTSEVTVGALDRNVKGRCLLGASMDGTGFGKARISLRAGMTASLLAHLISATNEQQRTVITEKPEYIKAMIENKTYWGQIRQDGTFEFEGVAPGDYELIVQDVDGVATVDPMKDVHAPAKRIRIPEDASASEFDLGHILIKRVHAKDAP